MKKILAIAGSNSITSINKQLLEYIAAQLDEHEVKVVDLNQYEFPMYSVEHEKERSFPVDVQVLKNIIAEHDAVIISVAEHNGSVSAYFKNIIDWLSRINRNFLADKKVLLTSTSPGQRGGKSALEFMKMIVPRFGGTVVESFSFPSFHENFDQENKRVSDEMLVLGLHEVLNTFSREIS
ncbi:NAD(P)H-dependent oxidoreductase [Gangjinia marincola]|uniref:NAD(P)H-dependent oxidoreductase n=1 Tax=Gangjinia marincola TaxID=578463 RepID=A0ABN1MGL2_9FLAO